MPLRDKQEITVLIPNEEKVTTLEPLRFGGMLRDSSLEEKAAFDEAFGRGVRFERKVQP